MSSSDTRLVLRQIAQYLFSLLPFHLTIKIVKMILASQGFGTGARVSDSGELRAVENLVMALGEESCVVFDVGANRGEYSLGVSRICPKCEIHAFEPSTNTYRLLEINCRQNNQVYLYNYGLGVKPETTTLYKESEYARIGSLTQLNVTNKRYSETVFIRTLDHVVDEFGLKTIHLIKIDVEGHELDVILGGQKAIESNKVKAIQFEIGGSSIDTNTTFKDIFDYLTACKFNMFLIKRRGLERINYYDYIYEQYSTTNFLAVSESVLFNNLKFERSSRM